MSATALFFAAAGFVRPSALARVVAPARPAHTVTAAHLIAMTSTPQKVGVVGATGAVGKEVIGVLTKRGYPMSSIRLFGSERSAGTKVATSLGDVTIEAFNVDAARETDVLFLCVDGTFALEHGPKLSAPGGPIVIDNSSAFRRDPNIPLIVPEINAASGKGHRLIANPNCTTAILLMALAPLVALLGIKKLIVSTYQAASGAGAEGMAELQEGLAAGVAGKPVTNKVRSPPCAARHLALSLRVARLHAPFACTPARSKCPPRYFSLLGLTGVPLVLARSDAWMCVGWCASLTCAHSSHVHLPPPAPPLGLRPRRPPVLAPSTNGRSPRTRPLSNTAGLRTPAAL